MYNARDIITVTYSRPKNYHITRHRHNNPYVESRLFNDDKDGAKAFIAGVLAKGERIISVRNGIGQTIQL